MPAERLPEMPPVFYRQIKAQLWRLLHDWSFYGIAGGKDYEDHVIMYDGTTGWTTLKVGWFWDRCSIPWGLRWLFRKTEKTLEPGAAHDAHYYLGRKGIFFLLTGARGKGDWFFWRNMVAEGVAGAKARWMRRGVRTGGWYAFNRKP